MIIAISPALIMALVGSLCFFLIEVFYRGEMKGAMSWVMFWFVVASILVARIAIESGRDRAAVFGFCLAVSVWFYMSRTTGAYLLALLLLGIVWYCAHKLVWDCTLIDDDHDSSGEGLFQTAMKPVRQPGSAKTKTPVKRPARKVIPPQNPGRSVIYFSLAAVPLFGLGQMLLPSGGAERRLGLIFLCIYLAAGLGLLVTTSFLGLRRYLRQRYLQMPGNIAVAWLKFGVGVALTVLIVAVFFPRPGANEAWAALSYEINYKLQQASQYAAPQNPPGKGNGKPGSESGGKEGAAKQPSQEQEKPPGSGNQPSSQTPPPTAPAPSVPVVPGGSIFNFLRAAFYAAAALAVGWWVITRRHLLFAMLRSLLETIREFIKRLLDLTPSRKIVKPDEPQLRRQRVKYEFADYRNPFFSARDHEWPPEQIILYSYEAVQVWAKEQGIEARPQETAREFCRRLGLERDFIDGPLQQLSRLYAYTAYGKKLPPDSDLEPIRELWRMLPTSGVHTLPLAAR